MNYKFSNFTGKLSAPSPLEIPSKFGKGADGPTIQYMQGTKIQVTDHPVPSRGNFAPVPEALKKKMRLFQMPNDLPVHIKGGPFDRVLFALTGAICFVGLVEVGRVFYVLSYPPKAKE
ncbi:hypothetical protein OTU49_008352 [Cherax quadricarinatus]|uniref:Uncharacterized protein n=1 Tax=Cherax quadricarinatus TaxID=27406 RepID=A0AAW0WQV6_CHEQU